MEDSRIVELFLARQETAVAAAQEKYAPYCLSVARRILGNDRDAEEAVNDALLAAWNSIPPQHPEILSSYLAKLTSRIAIGRVRRNAADKRGGGEWDLALEEMEDVLPGPADPAGDLEAKDLEAAVGRFLKSLPEADRLLFLARYWHFRPMAEIARAMGCREGAVRTRLHRLRRRLKALLEKEGYLS